MRRVRSLIIAFTLCAAAFCALLFFGGGKKRVALAGGVYINEVMASNSGTVSDGLGNCPDYVELHNPNSSAIDISGYGLTDTEDSVKWPFPSGTVVEGGGFIVVYCSSDISAGPLYAPFAISNKETIRLTDASGITIDSLNLENAPKNASLSKTESGEWVDTIPPTPGFENTMEGREAYINALSDAALDNGVRLNEFMASNITTIKSQGGEYPDFIELYNTSDKPVDLSGHGLSDDIGRPLKWVFPEGSIIGANEALLIYCSGRDGIIDGELNATFKLNSFAGSIVLSAPNGAVLDSYTYGEQSADISMARTPDGTGSFNVCALPTPGYPNTADGLIAFTKEHDITLGNLYISEALSSNDAVLTVDGNEPDWIEIYAAETVNLSGYSLTDNPKNPRKWVLPDYTLNAGEYFVILATGNDVTDVGAKYLEAGFKLSMEGDAVFMYDAEGELIDKLRLGKLSPDISVGRTNGSLRYYDTPTPGEANGEGYMGLSARPELSVLPGVFDAPITLELISEDGADIYYTMDATPPTSASTRYTAPITISSNTVIRAASIKPGYLTGAVRTGTYLFTSDDVNHSLPIATLVMDPDDLWNDITGIYANGPDFDPENELPFSTANYYKKGDEWERPAAFSVFSDDGKEAFEQNIYARIAGSYGRRHPQKGFNLIARASAGNSRMEYSFFDNRPYTSYKALVLRAGAQDQPLSKIRDELSLGLLEGTDVNILYQAYKPYVLYLNGEYWGVYFLKEKRNRFFVAQHEGIENNTDLDLMKAVGRVNHGTDKDWAELMSYIKSHDLTNAEAFNYVAERVDLDSFRDYMATEIYVANSDYWNIQYYKTYNGKWKWIYYDFCWGWHTVDHKTVTLRRQSDKPCSDLFNALLKNAAWKDDFVRRIGELSKTVYAPSRVNALIDELYAYVQPEIERERAKFNQSTFKGVATEAQSRSSYSIFETHIKRIRDFAEKRADYLKENLKNELGLSDEYIREVFS